MKKPIVFLGLLLITGMQIYSQWTVKNPKDLSVQFIQIRPADKFHVIAASISGIITTSDAGENWISPNENSSFPYYSPGLLALAGTSYISGSLAHNLSIGWFFSGMKSLDFGHSWVPVQTVKGRFNSISFGSDSVGYTADIDGRQILKTIDGGFTWKNVPGNVNFTNINSIFFVNDSIGWIAANGVLKTTDGGMHWSQPAHEYLKFYGVYFFNINSGWIFTDKNLYRTTDGGNNWIGLSFNSGLDTLKTIVFVNKDYGFLLSNKNVFKTVNAGSKWEKMDLPVTTSGLNDMALAKDSSIWICGNDGLILRLKNEYIQKDLTKPPDHYSLAQNFPNPFNPTTSIHYSLPKSEFVILKIFDMLGKEAAVLVKEVKDAGDHAADFNAAGLTGGVYIYQLTAGSFRQSRKMLLLR